MQKQREKCPMCSCHEIFFQTDAKIYFFSSHSVAAYCKTIEMHLKVRIVKKMIYCCSFKKVHIKNLFCRRESVRLETLTSLL